MPSVIKGFTYLVNKFLDENPQMTLQEIIHKLVRICPNFENDYIFNDIIPFIYELETTKRLIVSKKMIKLSLCYYHPDNKLSYLCCHII